MQISKRKLATIYAHNIGYILDNNRVISPLSGKTLKIIKSNKGYNVLSVSMEGKIYTIPYHFLVAYSKFKEEFLVDNIQVRHLDGNKENNNPDNIALGYGVDNAQDKSPVIRRNASMQANRHRRKIADDILENVILDKKAGLSNRELAEKYKVKIHVIYSLFNSSGITHYADELLIKHGFLIKSAP